MVVALPADTLSEGCWSPSQASAAQLAKIAPTLGKKYTENAGYSSAALGYAVAEVLTDALARAGSTSAGKLDRAISKTDVQTTAGLIKFDQVTHTAITPYYITQWQHGKLVQVQPLSAGVTLQLPTAGLSAQSRAAG